MDTKRKLVELTRGVAVERDVLRIAERISEYDDNLYLQYADPARSNLYDAPYRLVERCKDGIDRVVFVIWELNEAVLERIYAADTSKHNILESIERKNLLAKQAQIRRYQDKMDMAADIVRHIVESPKTRYSFPNHDETAIVTVDEQRPVEVREK